MDVFIDGALLNIRRPDVLRGSPLVGAVWETFVFQQLRRRERYGAGGGLYFWRDRTREVDFVVDRGGKLELLEAKYTELPSAGDTVNLRFVRDVVGPRTVGGCLVVCKTPNPFPMIDTVRAASPRDLIPN